MKVAFIPKREDAKRSEESIGCHSHNYFDHTGVRRVGQHFQGLQQSKAVPKSTVASRKTGRTTCWECLGITFLLHGAQLMLLP